MNVKMIGGKYRGKNIMISVDIEEKDKRINFKFGYNEYLKDEIKAMEGARFDWDTKVWSVVNNQRNQWWIRYLKGENPFEWYDRPHIDYIPEPRLCYRCYPLSVNNPNCRLCHGEGVVHCFEHQVESIQSIITYHHILLAEEMGLGKTLSAIIALEYAYLNDHIKNIWWVGPRAGLVAVQLEFKRWKTKLTPAFITYDELKKYIDYEPPQAIVFDEIQRIRNATTQRAQAARIIADKIRDKFDKASYIIGLSWTPSPKDPSNWYNLCETLQPGFIKEGNIHKFKNKLAIITMKEGISGGSYPEVVSWLDDEKKCKICGLLKDHPNHDGMQNGFHRFEKSVNEVERLGRRMEGLVLVKTKKTCLDLPDKCYEIIQVQPSIATLNAMEIIKSKSSRAIQALILCRELSDGFQYQISEDRGMMSCPLCNGRTTIAAAIAPKVSEQDNCPYCDWDVDAGSLFCDNCGNYLESNTTVLESP